MAHDILLTSPIKWAGGKRWLLPALLKIFPQKYNWYFEPFAGGASSFFCLRPKHSVLADMNFDLVSTYKALKDEPDKVWSRLKRHSRNHSDRYYYQVRDSRPYSASGIAARFLYLNRTCWNGLFRVNRQGKFNVPRGTKNQVLLSSDDPGAVASALRNTEIIWSDFEMVVDCAGKGDLIYADPPYTVKHNFNGFLKYNESIFSWGDQERLAESLRRACRRGVHVVVSNADHPSIRSLYKTGFEIQRIARNSVLSGDAAYRCLTTELIIIGGPR